MKFMIDSGAYTAWTTGTTIDREEYHAYLKTNASRIVQSVVLDVIPGERGRGPKMSERAAAADASYSNWQAAAKAGLDVMPVFHIGEDFNHLERYLAEGVPYIGLGGMAAARSSILDPWLAAVFRRVAPQGSPRCMIHGLGMTRGYLMARFPFASVDSRSWRIAAATGDVLFPKWRNGRPNYAMASSQILMSQSSKASYNTAADSIERISPMVREFLEAYLVEEVGVTLADVTVNTSARVRANLHFFQQLEAETHVKIWAAVAYTTADLQVMKGLGWQRLLYSYAVLRERAPNVLDVVQDQSVFPTRGNGLWQKETRSLPQPVPRKRLSSTS